MNLRILRKKMRNNLAILALIILSFIPTFVLSEIDMSGKEQRGMKFFTIERFFNNELAFKLKVTLNKDLLLEYKIIAHPKKKSELKKVISKINDINKNGYVTVKVIEYSYYKLGTELRYKKMIKLEEERLKQREKNPDDFFNIILNVSYDIPKDAHYYLDAVHDYFFYNEDLYNIKATKGDK